MTHVKLTAEQTSTSRMTTFTATAPSAWASFLINGDASGIEADELRAAQEFADWNGGTPVSCEDAGFIKYHDAYDFVGLAADCQTYTFLAR